VGGRTTCIVAVSLNKTDGCAYFGSTGEGRLPWPSAYVRVPIFSPRTAESVSRSRLAVMTDPVFDVDARPAFAASLNSGRPMQTGSRKRSLSGIGEGVSPAAHLLGSSPLMPRT
jgi:hypothetical protein